MPTLTYCDKPATLGQIAEFLGPDATDEDAAKMRDALLAAGIDELAGIDETVWHQIMHDTFAA
jgi:hypothetical protein